MSSALDIAFADRLFLTLPEAAQLLEMDTKTLRDHVRHGDIRYSQKGCGTKRPRRRFTREDVEEFIATQRKRDIFPPPTSGRRRRRRPAEYEPIGFLEMRAAERVLKKR